jgi:hypothetical protein
MTIFGKKKQIKFQEDISPEEIEHIKQIEEDEYHKTLTDTKQERLQKLEEEARLRGRARAMGHHERPPLSKAFGVGLKRTINDTRKIQNQLKGYGSMFPSASVFSTKPLNSSKPAKPIISPIIRDEK